MIIDLKYTKINFIFKIENDFLKLYSKVSNGNQYEFFIHIDLFELMIPEFKEEMLCFLLDHFNLEVLGFKNINKITNYRLNKITKKFCYCYEQQYIIDRMMGIK